MEHCPEILVRFIDPNNQRYPTSGDWLYDAESHKVEVRVSRMGEWRSELAVALHEIFEAVNCHELDVSETDVTCFDLNFEKERGDGLHGDYDEPGDSKDAPYHVPHVGATFVEKEVCAQSGLNWEQHEKNVNEL